MSSGARRGPGPVLRIVLALAALVVAGVVAFIVYFDTVAGEAIRRGATQALGVETRVGWVRIRPLAGVMRTGSVRVANPPGFETPLFMAFSSGRLDVTLESLRAPVIQVPLLEIDGVEAYLETAHGETNYAAILRHLRQFRQQGGGAAASDAHGASVQLIIRRLVVRDITAHIDSGRLAGDADRVDVEIPELTLRDVGTAGAGGASIAEVSDTVVRAVLIAVAKEAPAELVRGLLGSIGTLGSATLELPETATSVIEKLGEGAGKALDGLRGLFHRD